MRKLVPLLSVLSVIAAAACGGASGGEEPAGPTEVDVGVIPIADVAPLFLGKEKGFFEAEGLAVRTHFAQGGAAIVPSVASGEYQFGFSNVVSLMIANTKGLPLRIVSQGVQGPEDASGSWSGLLVAGDGPIQEPADLEGEKVGVLTLDNIGHVVGVANLAERGVDVSKVSFVEVPPPEMPLAVSAGKVAAVNIVEPFLTEATSEGARVLMPSYTGIAPNLTVATYFTTAQYIQQNSQQNDDVVAAFVRAMERSLDYAASHPDEARKIIPTYTEIAPEVAAEIQLPQWSSDLNEPSIRKLADVSVQYGFLDGEPDLAELIHAEGKG